MNLPEADTAAPSIVSFANLTVAVETHSELFDAQLEMSIESISAGVDAPKVVSIPCRAPRVAVKTYVFPEAPEWAVDAPPKKKPADNTTATEGPEEPEVRNVRKPATRIKPPSDVIKLQDRLYYLLQPSLESLVSAGSLDFPFEPFPYQFEGIAFLYPRHAAVLADEMGLGKTMQAISTIRMLIRSGEARNILLICPKPLVTNWKREFALWAPEIPVSIIEGDQARRTWQWQSAESPVRIANYELLMRDQQIVNDESLRFDLVVLDEAQRIKNTGSTTAQIVRAIPRDRSWALTGTPIENCTDDLVGIFEFLVPGYLYKGMPLKQLCTATSEYIIRRTKDEVLEDMPPRLYRDADLTLSPAQQETYELAENEGIVRLEKMGEELTVQHVFELVLRLKQICNFDPRTGDSTKMDQLRADMEEVAASGKKAIVFSQWTQTIEQIRRQLEPFGPLEYHGKIPSKKRDGVIEQFKHDPTKSVILMSYGAGSVGLNLQFCEYVFLFDRWWNPAIEDQAINRAHRIGAKGAVTISRYLAMNTIEDRIDQVLSEKRELFNTLFAEAGTPPPGGLSKDDIFGLFNLRSPKGPIRLAA
ncbi:DEAD/DEAH box helicase [Blastopirellula sp. J2-11]|uniref:DEAD/DEAH box helicase n=1 Tax=Blastopirellula sp. J2-11 TaxID=2943192 RepID=UPI0021C97E33|nr:DEAD/DEAH box helicase [Blastopirellula sp. J2-11]UUO07429.1 DEAD/DEAH box helicase [Blastopirellula sp. J2-11]